MDSDCTTTILNNQDVIIDFDPSAKRPFNLADKSGVGLEGTSIIAGTGEET